MNKHILTSRLNIKSYTEADLDQHIALYSDEKLMKYFDFGVPLSKAEVIRLTDCRSKNLSSGELPIGLYSIFLRENGNFIGQCDLLPSETPGALEIGFIVKPKYQNLGYCTECVKGILDHLTCELIDLRLEHLGKPINWVIATAHPKNISSIKVLQKVGMHRYKVADRFLKPRYWYKYDLFQSEGKSCQLC